MDAILCSKFSIPELHCFKIIYYLYTMTIFMIRIWTVITFSFKHIWHLVELLLYPKARVYNCRLKYAQIDLCYWFSNTRLSHPSRWRPQAWSNMTCSKIGCCLPAIRCVFLSFSYRPTIKQITNTIMKHYSLLL